MYMKRVNTYMNPCCCCFTLKKGGQGFNYVVADK